MELKLKSGNFDWKWRAAQQRRWLGLWLAILLSLPLFTSGLVSTALAASLSATNSPQVAGGIVTFSGEGFAANERLGAWVTGPDGVIRGVISGTANSVGQVTYNLETLGFVIGRWTFTLHGVVSQNEATAPFELVSSLPPSPGGGGGSAPTPTPTPTPPPADAKIVGSRLSFTIEGFQANEAVSVWTTDPNGSTAARSSVTAGNTGRLDYSLDTFGFILGRWAITFHGVKSGVEVVKTFTLVNSLPPEPGKAAPTPTPVSTEIPKGGLQVSPDSGFSGQIFQISGTGYTPGERISIWETNPLGYATTLSTTLYSDRDGNVGYSYQKYTFLGGIWSVTIHGMTSGVEKTGYLRLLVDSPGTTPAPDTSANLQISPDHGTASTVINATGTNFLPNESYSFWLTAPDGTVYSRNPATVGSDGKFSFSYSIPAQQPGQWGLTVNGNTSKRQAVAFFKCDNI